MGDTRTIHYFTNLAPHYRSPLWQLMAGDMDLDFKFFFGKPGHKSIREISFEDLVWHNSDSKTNHLKNRRLFNRVIWQSGVLSKVLFSKIEQAIFLGDMNIVSTWLAAMILRIKGSRVYFWGHGFSGNEILLKKYLRILFNKLAHKHFIYGDLARKLMIKYGFPEADLNVIYNSLDYGKHKKIRELVVSDSRINLLFENFELPILVFIGRLTAIKKLEILIKAVHVLNKSSIAFNLLIIGDGPVRSKLEEMAEDLLQKGTYHFHGSCYDEIEIGRLLSNSDLCVSPGNVGLTAIHSLSFGTPVCSHNNFGNQMPEYESIIPGRTGFFFKEDDVDDLVVNIQKWFGLMIHRDKIREECYKVIDRKYNPHHQMDIFRKVLLADG